MKAVTRFAPSPTGLLHVGNAYSALFCQHWAESHHASVLLRIEDIDFTRCKPEYSQAIIEDLSWLGFAWQGAVSYQSQRRQAYSQAITTLREMGLIYPCFCTRKAIQQEIKRMASAPHAEDMPEYYPGICRNMDAEIQAKRMQQEMFSWRLDITKAMQLAGDGLQWLDEHGRSQAVNINHDMIIGRKDIGFSYHLAVVVDDAAQGITHVIRGIDLEPSTAIHRLLQHLLDLPAPRYIHHPLLLGPDGHRLAKRNRATTLHSLREMGVDAQTLGEFLFSRPAPEWPFAEQDDQAILRALGNSG